MISLRFDGEIKTFTVKQKLREFSTTKPALQQMLKELLKAGNTREGKDLQKQNKTELFEPKPKHYLSFLFVLIADTITLFNTEFGPTVTS